MGSIASTLNSINTSLLSEISSFNNSQSPTGTSASSTASTAVSSDQVDFSQVAQLLKQLKQLQQSNPAEFKQVLTDAASKLKTAASQAADPKQAAFLNNLANKFTTAASTGDLSALQPDSNSEVSANSAQGYHHHHHGGGGNAANLLSSILGTSSTSPTGGSPTDQIQSLLAGVVSSQ